jgi:hypothetical protein
MNKINTAFERGNCRDSAAAAVRTALLRCSPAFSFRPHATNHHVPQQQSMWDDC